MEGLVCYRILYIMYLAYMPSTSQRGGPHSVGVLPPCEIPGIQDIPPHVIESANPLGQPIILRIMNVPLNIVTYNKKNYDKNGRCKGSVQ